MKTLFVTTLLIIAMETMSKAQVPGQPVPMVTYPPSQEQAVDLPKFDIFFEGGFPRELVQEIERRLLEIDDKLYINVIIPREFENIRLPALKMRNVDAAQLFKALEFASMRQVTVNAGRTIDASGGSRMIRQASTMRYGFRTAGPITPESIWYFYVEKPAEEEPSTIVRYYQLAPYLNEFSMDDIGSALNAGWKMLGETNTPKLNFHADTKLLIAVGTPEHLAMIQSMLSELGAGMTHQPGSKKTSPPPPVSDARRQ